MVEQKHVSSYHVKKTPKSQLTGEPPPQQQKQTLKLTKTDILYSKTKEKPQDIEGVQSQYNQIPYVPGGQHTNWGIITSQRSCHKSESSKPHIRLPILGSGIERRLWSTELGERETLLLEGTRKVSWRRVSRGKAATL